jgi:hypothetical protein
VGVKNLSGTPMTWGNLCLIVDALLFVSPKAAHSTIPLYVVNLNILAMLSFVTSLRYSFSFGCVWALIRVL